MGNAGCFRIPPGGILSNLRNRPALTLIRPFKNSISLRLEGLIGEKLRL